jgi:hypothetical protein
MRDASNVIAFTLALKFAFIVIQFLAGGNQPMVVLRHQKIVRSCSCKSVTTWRLLPGNVLMHQLGPYRLRITMRLVDPDRMVYLSPKYVPLNISRVLAAAALTVIS